MYLNPTDTDNSIKLPIDQDAWMFFRFDNHELIRIDLAPGEAIENHTNDWRIVFYILRGEGTLNVEGITHNLSSGRAIAVQARKERFWHNTGKETLELLVIKTEDRE